MNVLELSRKLIEIESCTGEETDIMEYLSRYLENIGFRVTRQVVDGRRFNIFAASGVPRAVFSTHTDTVRPYFPFSQDNDYIYGRGACDTKGIIAAMLKASEHLLAEGTRDFGILLVVGEEGPSDGAMAANTMPNQCMWLINGEPTENRMALGSKGTVRAKLTVTGRACHSAYPEMGESAIDKLLDILADIRRIDWPKHDLLGETTCNIGLIEGGVQPNVVAPHALAHIMVRVVSSTEEIRGILSETVRNRGDLDFYSGYEPVLTYSPKGFDTMVAAYGTDIPYLTAWGKPLLFGPGSILDAHSACEKISKRQLHEAVDHYYRLIKDLLTQPPQTV